ncbi:MAG TPA: FecR domain-containing protein [Puia sp.]|nr:FecR domain-containing protein [Puia sp.]
MGKHWTKERWEYLVERYLTGTCSREEMDELLMQAGKDPGNKDLAEALQKHWDLSNSPSPAIDWDTRLQTIMRQSSAPLPVIPRWRWYAAVASVFIVFVSGILFWSYIRRGERQPAVATIKKGKISNDVQPGGNKAILTLANGSTVTLDNAQNGSLGVQDNMKIVKKANGLLAYEKEGKAMGNGQPLYNMISTPRGGQYQVVLPDGSKVWLNASSSLRFPTDFTRTERKVEIVGEGYFEIVKDASRPFKVSVLTSKGSQTVEVLGTSFNVMAYNEENMVQTTLVDGAVKVRNGQTENLLEPGQQAQSAMGEPIVHIVRDADVAAAIAWKNGYFNFNKESLQTVMRQLARWYDVDVSYIGSQNEKVFWGGMQRDLPLSSVFKILEKSGVQFSIEGKRVIVTN